MLAYNGNVVNVAALRRELSGLGVRFAGTSDAEVLAYKLAAAVEDEGDLVEGVAEVMRSVDGAYSVVGLLRDGTLFAFRDPWGVRPLAYGAGGEGASLLVASETPALDVNGVPFAGYVGPGELLVAGEGGLSSYRLAPGRGESLCAFEYAYFARPDSRLPPGDRYVYEVRRELGRRLAERYAEVASRVDVVVPVPETAVDAAQGFHEASGVPVEPLIVRHRYVRLRAFIMGRGEREAVVSRKYNVLARRVDGKRVALVDDSIVRGDTLRRLVRALRAAGAREVHVLSTFPKIEHPCFYGIDMATYEELVGFGRSAEEVAEVLGADSVSYQSVGDFRAAVGYGGLCMACVTGRYPTPCAQRLADEARERAAEG